MRAYIGPQNMKNDYKVVHVELHPQDTWNMDLTLSYIILPMLQQFKATSNGYPKVSSEDIPETIEPESSEAWSYILDEMMYAFSSIQQNGQISLAPVDIELKRVDNGLRLFGKYYRNLWD